MPMRSWPPSRHGASSGSPAPPGVPPNGSGEGWRPRSCPRGLKSRPLSTGRPPERVRRGVAALKLPERLQEPAVIGEVSFEEARQLESFSDDPSTYRRLLNHLGERNFPYLLAQAHRDREVAQEKASSRA